MDVRRERERERERRSHISKEGSVAHEFQSERKEIVRVFRERTKVVMGRGKGISVLCCCSFVTE